MGRTACTDPQCLYKGDLYLLPSCVSVSVLGTSIINRRFDDRPCNDDGNDDDDDDDCT